MIFENTFVIFYIFFQFLKSASHVNGYNCAAETDIAPKNCSPFVTSLYDYRDFFPISAHNNENKTLVFYIKGDQDAHILLSGAPNEKGRVYEIALGANNVRAIIRPERKGGGAEYNYYEGNIISSSEWRRFWINVSVGGLISVGRKDNNTAFLSWKDPNPFTVAYYSFASYDNHVLNWLHQCSDQSAGPIIMYYEEKLKCFLFSNYNKQNDPFDANTVTYKTLSISITSWYTDLDANNGIIQLNGEIQEGWIDNRLLWKSNEHNNLISLKLMEDLLWRPTIRLINDALRNGEPLHLNDTTILSNTGFVTSTTTLSIYAKCNKDSNLWSAESHTCPLDFSANGFNIDITFQNRKRLEIISLWTVATSWSPKNSNSSKDPISTIELTLQRNISQAKLSYCTDLARNYSEKLACQLFSNYDQSIPPLHFWQGDGKQKIQEFIITSFYADLDVNGIFQLIGEIISVWKDDRLTWNPRDYGDIKTLSIDNQSPRAWTPVLTLKNAVFPNNLPSSSSHVEINYNGDIRWTASINIMAKCNNANARRWLMNFHTCHLEFATNILPAIFQIQDGINSTTDSPWLIKTQQINTSLTEVKLERNTDYFRSTRCISFAASDEENLECHINSQLDRSEPRSDLLTYGLRIAMTISYIDLNIENEVFQLDGQVQMKWKDERLTWDPDKFGDQFSSTITNTDSIWKPQLILIKENLEHDPFGLGRLESSSNGDLTWISPMNIITKCETSTNNWPWNPHKCLLRFRTNTVHLHFNFSNVENVETMSTWTIVSILHFVEHDFGSFLEITLQTKNVSLQIILCLIFTAVNLLVLSSFLINSPKRIKIKIVAKATSIILLVAFVALLAYSIPHFVYRVSNFLIGYTILLLLVGISSGLTVSLVRLPKTSISYSPSSHQNPVEQQENQSKEDTIKECLMEVETKNSKSKDFQKDWLKIAMVIEWLLFIICAVLALLLTVSFIIVI